MREYSLQNLFPLIGGLETTSWANETASGSLRLTLSMEVLLVRTLTVANVGVPVAVEDDAVLLPFWRNCVSFTT